MTLAERDGRHLWHPYTQHGIETNPLPVKSAAGAVLTLEDDRQVIDAISSWWTCLHGHGHPVLVETMQRQAKELDHVLFAGTTHAPAVELAEALVAVTPAGLERVFYSDDGSTAVEVALKMVFQSWVHRGEPERRVFVALEGSYHGDTFGAMAVGDPDPFFEPFASLLFEVRRVPPEADALQSTLDDLGQRAAGLIVEPLVQGAAGMRMHTAEFLRAARAACTAAGIPLIADEVMTGFGRTGALFACKKAGVEPDLMCLAKGLTGGVLPLAATLATDAIYQDFLSSDRARAFFHGHSMTAHPIGCAVAAASLTLCQEEDVPGKLDRIGASIEAGLSSLCDHPAVREIRRTGGIVALELEPSEEGKGGYLAADPPAMRKRAIELGVLLRPLGNVIYALPPACTDDDQCQQIAAAMVELVSGQ